MKTINLYAVLYPKLYYPLWTKPTEIGFVPYRNIRKMNWVISIGKICDQMFDLKRKI